MTNKKIIPVVLCGGSGTRLWPISREKMPKQFLNLVGDASLLQETVMRATDIAGASPEDLVVVTLAAMKGEVVQQLKELNPAYTQNILSEPLARNTAGAIAFAATYVMEKFGADTIMWVLPSDHHIGNEKALEKSLKDSLPTVESGHLVTFGINPTRPETGYGYIRVGEKIDAENNVFAAGEFKEKPNAATAQSYLDDGHYLWNSGMFLFNTDTLLMNFRQFAPDIQTIVRESMAKNSSSPAHDIYATLPEVPFDTAIMEKSQKVAVVPCNPAWSDIGGWESLWEISDKDEHGNVTDGKAALYNTQDCIVYAQDRLVAVAGLKNIVVAETGDAVLVADKRDGDSMKILVKALKKAGQKEVADPVKETRPWGILKLLSENTGYKIKEITLMAGEKLSLQSHNHRTEFWTVLDGEALVTLDDEQKVLKAQDSLHIPAKALHRMENIGKTPLKVIEIQSGAYIGEDDVVRYEDAYGRSRSA